MLARWNGEYGENSSYINDDGSEASWQEVQEQHGIGQDDDKSKKKEQVKGERVVSNSPGTGFRKKGSSYEKFNNVNAGGNNGDADALAEFTIGFSPAGTVLDLYTLTTGKEYSTNNEVSWGGRLFGIVPLVSEIRKARKIAPIVLGHYPGYLKLADEVNAHRFKIPTDIWNTFTDAQKWEANKKFLDRAINSGREILLSTPLNKVKEGSYFQMELNYLFNKGYKPSSDGKSLIK